jgi:predicted transcriptional regulator
MPKEDSFEKIKTPREPDACETRTPHDHVMMFKTLENPLRRRILKRIGVFGRKRDDLQGELDISEDRLKFQIDFLIKACYVEAIGDTYKLTEKGIALLSSIKD